MVIRWIQLKSLNNWMNRQKVLVFGFYGEGNLGDGKRSETPLDRNPPSDQDKLLFGAR
jgi:hypothetical protein